MKKPTRQQWEQLRTLDKMLSKAPKKSLREKYLKQQVDILRESMGLSSLGPSWSDVDVATDKHLPDSLSADAEDSSDLGAVQTLFDIE